TTQQQSYKLVDVPLQHSQLHLAPPKQQVQLEEPLEQRLLVPRVEPQQQAKGSQTSTRWDRRQGPLDPGQQAPPQAQLVESLQHVQELQVPPVVRLRQPEILTMVSVQKSKEPLALSPEQQHETLEQPLQPLIGWPQAPIVHQPQPPLPEPQTLPYTPPSEPLQPPNMALTEPHLQQQAQLEEPLHRSKQPLLAETVPHPQIPIEQPQQQPQLVQPIQHLHAPPVPPMLYRQAPFEQDLQQSRVLPVQPMQYPQEQCEEDRLQSPATTVQPMQHMHVQLQQAHAQLHRPHSPMQQPLQEYVQQPQFMRQQLWQQPTPHPPSPSRMKANANIPELSVNTAAANESYRGRIGSGGGAGSRWSVLVRHACEIELAEDIERSGSIDGNRRDAFKTVAHGDSTYGGDYYVSNSPHITASHQQWNQKPQQETSNGPGHPHAPAPGTISREPAALPPPHILSQLTRLHPQLISDARFYSNEFTPPEVRSGGYICNGPAGAAADIGFMSGIGITSAPGIAGIMAWPVSIMAGSAAMPGPIAMARPDCMTGSGYMAGSHTVAAGHEPTAGPGTVPGAMVGTCFLPWLPTRTVNISGSTSTAAPGVGMTDPGIPAGPAVNMGHIGASGIAGHHVQQQIQQLQLKQLEHHVQQMQLQIELQQQIQRMHEMKLNAIQGPAPLDKK
ncbi:hypothetical protein PLESTM_001376900, partial [Pleodorina starrii]